MAKLNESSFDNPPLFSPYSSVERENRAAEKDSCRLAGWLYQYLLADLPHLLFCSQDTIKPADVYIRTRNGLFVRKRGRDGGGGGGIFLKAVDNVSVMRSIDRK